MTILPIVLFLLFASAVTIFLYAHLAVGRPEPTTLDRLRKILNREPS